MTAFEDLSLLRAFVSIVEGGSISSGARRMKIPQPTVSRYLRQLEEKSGGPLLRRRLKLRPTLPARYERHSNPLAAARGGSSHNVV